MNRFLILNIFAAHSLLSSAAAVDAVPDPMTILHGNCVKCHTEAKRKGGLVLNSRESLLAGGDTGSAIIPGNSGESYLIEVLFPDHDSHMPPKGQLKPDEIVALEEWIDSGAEWDVAKWKKLNEPKIEQLTLSDLPDNYQPVLAMAVSSDGKWLAAAGGNKIDIYEVTMKPDSKEGPEFELRNTLESHRDLVQSLSFSTDNRKLASGGFRKVVIWNVEHWKKEIEIEDEKMAGRITAMAFRKNGGSLLIADSLPAQSGKIHEINVVSGQMKTVVSAAHDDTVFDLEFNADSSKFVTASADKLVVVRDSETFEPVVTLEGHTGFVLTVTFSPEGNRIASAGDDEAIKVWDLKSGKQVSSFSTRTSGPVTGLAWTLDPDKIAAKEKEKDEKKKEALNTDRIVAINELGKPGTFTDLVEHEGEQRSAGAREKAHDAVGEPLSSMAYDPDALILYSGTESGTIFVWDKNGKQIKQIESAKKEIASVEVAP